ncbi:MAG: hypothetical protein M1834_004603 [Cirrosporium novae-zelandiae]|nr:MAG: hypothetical protein M1834_004603 [Cirrosporium novae-zelandiae]
MDSPIVTQLFRQLFHHRPCPQRLSSYTPKYSSSSPLSSITTATHHERRQYVTRSSKSDTKSKSNWQQRLDWLPGDKAKEIKDYPTVTSESLRGRRERPRRVKLSMRDFIEDSLYNPNYGYFSKHAVIFHPGDPFDFNSMRSEPEFQRILDQRYRQFEDELDAKNPDDTRQLWHTPTELFQPYYGEAIADYLVTNYKHTSYPYHDLIIYEMGAGNGTLMLNILDFIRYTDPEVYARTKFKIIEISSSLADLQRRQVDTSTYARGHADHVSIINRSIFEWDSIVPSPCFFLALEVFDNFAHDCLRYDPITEQPMQGNVLIDADGEFYEFYTRTLSPAVKRYLRVRDAASTTRYDNPLLRAPKLIRQLRSQLPFAPNLTDPEYIPSRLLDFFNILHRYFPAHRLLASDFHYLPGAIRGINAPVVQTRYQRRVVPVSTPLVEQGYFDILFPTDFNLIEDIYRATTGKLTRVLTHEAFLSGWADLEETETRNGENPMLSWYKNASVLITV